MNCEKGGMRGKLVVTLEYERASGCIVASIDGTGGGDR